MDVFKDEFVTNIQTANKTNYNQWRSSNPAEASKWEKFRDDVIAGKSVVPPTLATKYGKALVAAGKLEMSVTDIGSVPPPAAPPPTGAVYDQWSDLHAFPPDTGDSVCINRWQNDGTNAIQSRLQTGPNWPAPVNGAAAFEITTPYGTGWRFICDQSMPVASGGKKSENLDDTILRNTLGQGKTLTTNVYFPSTGNVSGFPAFNAWNDLLDFHNAGIGCVFGVNGDSGFGPVPSFYMRVVGSSWDTHQHAPAAFLYNQWYEIKVDFKFATSAAYIHAYVNGVQFFNHVGQTMDAGQIPYLQFGFYSSAIFYNEVQFGPIVIS